MESNAQIIFYLILFGVIITINIVNANKKRQQKIEEYKKKQAMQKTMQTEMAGKQIEFNPMQPKPKPFTAQPVEDPLTEFLKKAFQQNEPKPAQERPLEDTVLEEVNIEAESLENVNYDEVSSSHIALNKTAQKPRIIIDNEQDYSENIDFDPRKAVIYSEIMNRRF